jgi:hypothetical protein
MRALTRPSGLPLWRLAPQRRPGLASRLGSCPPRARRASAEKPTRAGRQGDHLKVLGRKQVVFSALVDYSDLAVQFGVGIGPDLVDFAANEIDVVVLARVDA